MLWNEIAVILIPQNEIIIFEFTCTCPRAFFLFYSFSSLLSDHWKPWGILLQKKKIQKTLKNIFWSKVSIWYVNCVLTTAFIFDTWTDVSQFFRQKMSSPKSRQKMSHKKMLSTTGTNIKIITSYSILLSIVTYSCPRYMLLSDMCW